MKTRWVIVFLPVISVIAISLAVHEHAARAASSPVTAIISTAKAATVGVAFNTSRALAIPDTPLAINSDKPMSQRVLRYEIDAKYDAATHVVDATEVLTYHNLT